jgi:phosphinothricin acetyltransferase
MGSDFRVREATEPDLPRIQAIYNDAVLTTTATWDEAPWTWERRLEWWTEHVSDATTPVLVAAAEDGAVAGFAYLSRYRAKSGYRFTREDTVYIDPAYHRQGAGRLLLGALLERARTQGMHAILAYIEASNAASIAVHAGFGFEPIGRAREIGFKFGRWLDLVAMELVLGS